MKRKEFLGGILPLSIAAPSIAQSLHTHSPSSPTEDTEKKYAIPPALHPGDTIGICCPSGFIETAKIAPALQQLAQWGFRTQIGPTVGKRDFTFGGTDPERLSDLQHMLDDPTLKAILFARGGYGFIRIIDQLDFSAFRQHPKWLIGFSDATVIHAHIHQNCHVASIHSKMCNSFPDDPAAAEPIIRECIDSIRLALVGVTKMQYTCPASPMNRPGHAEGILIGGNLRTLENLAGTISDFNTKDKILFIEDVEEQLYNLDRMLWNFKRAGKLNQLKALIIGGFVRMKDDSEDPFGHNTYDIIYNIVKEYKYPVCFDFPVGHQKNNYALKCGILHQLTVGPADTQLTEL